MANETGWICSKCRFHNLFNNGPCLKCGKRDIRGWLYGEVTSNA